MHRASCAYLITFNRYFVDASLGGWSRLGSICKDRQDAESLKQVQNSKRLLEEVSCPDLYDYPSTEADAFQMPP